jgi:hypothetical protein
LIPCQFCSALPPDRQPSGRREILPTDSVGAPADLGPSSPGGELVGAQPVIDYSDLDSLTPLNR